MKKLYLKNLYIASHAPFAQTHFQKYILFFCVCGFPNYIYILVRTTYPPKSFINYIYVQSHILLY